MCLVLGQNRANLSTDLFFFPPTLLFDLSSAFLCLLTLYMTSQCDQKPPSNDRMGLFFRYNIVIKPRASLLRKTLFFKQGLQDRWNKQPFLYEEIYCVAVDFCCWAFSPVHLDVCFCKWSCWVVQKHKWLWAGFLGTVVPKEAWVFRCKKGLFF